MQQSEALSSHEEQRLYRATEIATPRDGWVAVGDEAFEAYQRDGFVAVAGAFTQQQVNAARDGIADLVAGRCPGFSNIEFEASAKAFIADLPVEQRLDHVRKLMEFVPFERRLAEMAAAPQLQAFVTRILGARPALLQDMALLKPARGREKPWHQDNAYFDIPQGTPVVGVWIALDEATAANGCMHLLRGGHRSGPVIHFKRRDWQICDTELVDRPCVAAPLAPGGCLVFDGMTPHGTPTNHSNQRRRAVQFHFVPEGTTRIDSSHRLAVFGSEGKDVSC